jgi:hypothetical protein
MPYAPGIQDISGQLLAQGMSQAGAARARSIESIGESLSNGIKQYQQNQNFTQQSLAKFYSNMQDPDYKDLVTKIISDDSNQMGVPSNLKKAIQNAGTGKIDAGQAAMLATWAQDFSERKNADAKTKQINLQNQNLQAEIDQRLKFSKMFEDMQKNNNPALNIPAKSAITNEQVSNASQFLPGASVLEVTPSVAPQTPSNRFRRVSDAPVAVSPVSPVAPAAAALEAFMPPEVAQAMSRSQMVNTARPIDQYRSLQPSDVSFSRGASAPVQSAKPVFDTRNIAPSVNAASTVAPVQRLMDPEALQAARQRFDTGISSPSEQFTLPQIKLSPEAKDIARRLREQYDESSAVLERRAATPRLTAVEDEGKTSSLKKKKTITLDEEGIKAILSNPRILVESFGDVMGDPYERAMRNQATDAAFRQNAQLRELERQFGVRTPARRGK